MPSGQFRTSDCLADIVDNVERIERHVADLNQEDLAKDGLRRDAVERCLERICEAGCRLGGRAEALMPEQSWRAVRGLGNWLDHAYDRIDFAVIWNIVSERLAPLKADAATALARLEAQDDGPRKP